MGETGRAVRRGRAVGLREEGRGLVSMAEFTGEDAEEKTARAVLVVRVAERAGVGLAGK